MSGEGTRKEREDRKLKARQKIFLFSRPNLAHIFSLIKSWYETTPLPPLYLLPSAPSPYTSCSVNVSCISQLTLSPHAAHATRTQRTQRTRSTYAAHAAHTQQSCEVYDQSRGGRTYSLHSTPTILPSFLGKQEMSLESLHVHVLLKVSPTPLHQRSFHFLYFLSTNLDIFTFLLTLDANSTSRVLSFLYNSIIFFRSSHMICYLLLIKWLHTWYDSFIF